MKNDNKYNFIFEFNKRPNVPLKCITPYRKGINDIIPLTPKFITAPEPKRALYTNG